MFHGPCFFSVPSNLMNELNAGLPDELLSFDDPSTGGPGGNAGPGATGGPAVGAGGGPQTAGPGQPGGGVVGVPPGQQPNSLITELNLK